MLPEILLPGVETMILGGEQLVSGPVCSDKRHEFLNMGVSVSDENQSFPS